jgi:S-adenosylmethionine:tRNA ribosyltransferase-isomerase
MAIPNEKTAYKLNNFLFDVPEEKVAQYPLDDRTSCKMLVLDKESGEMQHLQFKDLVDHINPGDVFVVNETKVLPARIFAKKERTDGMIEILLLRQLNGNIWEVLVKPARKVRIGNRLKLNDTVHVEVIDNTESGGRVIEFYGTDDVLGLLDQIGETPLPPYIERDSEPQDKDNYQTIFAKRLGAVAAPTAGLHFDDALMAQLKDKGASFAPVLLHVGLGTFRPVQVDDITKHQMHAEYYEVSRETAEVINTAKNKGNRVIAVGTTVVRVLETVTNFERTVVANSGWTDKFIYPPHDFKIVDGLITNFHTPGSTLVMLVSAFAGYEHLMKAYQYALGDGYRFFSYGDAMFIK